MRTRKWSKLKLVKFTLAILILIFLILELFSRIHFYNKYAGTGTTIAVQGNTIQLSDSILVFKNRPFYTDYNLIFQFNEEGMKVSLKDSNIPSKTVHDFWVFLFGASAMEGMGSNKTGEWLNITGVTDYSWNESIAALLQKELQRHFPMKRVKVFCAAASSYTVVQSMLRFNQLSSKYKMDWVVSMDGNNEPIFEDSLQSTIDIIRNQWFSYPIHSLKTKLIIPFTTNSSFINYCKQFIYDFRQKKQLFLNKKHNYPARAFWYNKEVTPLVYEDSSKLVAYSAYVFQKNILAFDSLLKAKSINHLLLVQPHISLRKYFHDTTETAIFKYYSSEFNNPKINYFQSVIHNEKKYSDSNIIVLNMLHEAKFPVFVDYCHFTPEANNYIANIITQHITSENKRIRTDSGKTNSAKVY